MKEILLCGGIESKECTRCNKILPLCKFYIIGKYKNGSDIYSARCKECTSITSRECYSYPKKVSKRKEKWVVVNHIVRKKTISVNDIEYKECVGCGNMLPLTQFTKIGLYNNGDIKYMSKCVKCNRLRYQKHYLTYNIYKPEKWKVFGRKYAHAIRGFGYEPINYPFKGSHSHHLGTTPDGSHDKETTVDIPIELHRHGNGHYIHAPSTGKHGEGMIKKNTEAFLWYIENHPEDAENIEYLYDVMSATIQRTLDGWENAPGWQEWVEFMEALNNLSISQGD